ncbi:MAG: amidophosphoribosyltransferase [Spirochaetes bacterium]|nr:amidophosphoribosyltransferase [Spirochaetota bacterium]
MEKFKEKCGIFGIYNSSKKTKSEIPFIIYYGLYSLQHRGQESCGITLTDGKDFKTYKNMGLVNEVFSQNILENLEGFAGIGHVRYSTTGESTALNAQPFVVNSKLGNIAIAHNGNLVNSNVLKDLLEDSGFTFQTTSDSEVILSLIARSSKYGIERAVLDAISAIKGSFALVILFQDKLIAVRDPYGIRPLCYGIKDDYHIFASESCALDTVGAKFIRDLNPGEIIICDRKDIKSINFSEKTKKSVCIFEYIYFARPDSTIDGINVYKSRIEAGRLLSRNYPISADLVSGVPDSGIPAAIGFSKESNIPYELALIKNKYIGRTFINPSPELRKKDVSVKLNPLKEVIQNKRIVLIDDSIVRGTTGNQLVKIIRNSGAKEVHFRIASPIVRFPCYFGINIASRKELIGSNKVTINEIKKKLDADSVGYLTIDELLSIFGKTNENNFCLGCFTGEYPLSAPFEELDNEIEKKV